MFKKFLLVIVPFFSSIPIIAQKCEVLIDNLKGEYQGECQKGKANGKGIATGTDSYSGYFRKGVPDGDGKYTWKNGDWYKGSWKNGLFEGLGTLNKYDSTRKDSIFVLTGYWQRGKYLGKYEKSFVTKSLSNDINDINVRKQNSIQSELIITVKSITGGGISQRGNMLPKPSLVEMQVMQGRYEQQIVDENSPALNKYTFHNVTYPFAAVLSFRTIAPGPEKAMERVEIEIYETASWFVQISIDN